MDAYIIESLGSIWPLLNLEILMFGHLRLVMAATECVLLQIAVQLTI